MASDKCDKWDFDSKNRRVVSPMTQIDGQWKTIKTAPKDGTQVLLFAPARDNYPYVIRQSHWALTMNKWWDWVCPDRPTHWMPLPAPPYDH